LPEYKTILTQCAFLNRFSVTPRYPDEIEISADDVKIALRYANEVKDFIGQAALWN
jgi:hypothetical protein